MSDIRSDEALLNNIADRIHDSETLREVVPELMPDLLRLVRCERLTVYVKAKEDKELVSRYKVADALGEIRVTLSSRSIAGFVALTHKPVAIRNVYDTAELARHHERLAFDSSYDIASGYRTRSMLALPIKHKEVLVGVMQAINRVGEEVFTANDFRRATALAKLLAQKLKYELTLTGGPFDRLVEKGLVSREQLDEYLERSRVTGVTVTSLLVTQARLPPMEIGRSLEQHYQVPYQGYDPQHLLPQELMANLRTQYLRQRLWVPLDGDRREAVVLVDDPTDSARIDEMQRLLNAESYRLRVGMPEDILAYLGQKFGFFEQRIEIGNTDVRGLIQILERELERAGADKAALASPTAQGTSAAAELVDRIIFSAYRDKASDIHIEPAEDGGPTRIRFRVDGACLTMYQVPAEISNALVSRLKVLSQLDISERRRPQDGKLTLKAGEGNLELRVAILPTVQGESVVLRILSRSKPLPLSKIGLSADNLARLEAAISEPHGLVLVVGPTGSGKTTTLHAILRHLNTPDRKIWTAEDPVEITQPGLQQIQIQRKIGLDFAAAMRSFLRADPDVVMIGETRDRETAKAVVEASLTGHLVLSTLHTNSAPETVQRLLGLDIEAAHFIDAFRAVLAQRLVRTLCPSCKQAYSPGAEEIDRLRGLYGADQVEELGLDWDGLELYRPQGCEACFGSGYRGRLAVHELLKASPELHAAVASGGIDAPSLFRIGRATGMRTLGQDGIAKLLGGLIDLPSLKRVVGV
jgi:type II secretory ATPase GspE/PulE/Tfp pilus assembly ATPase PilB-like protein